MLAQTRHLASGLQARPAPHCRRVGQFKAVGNTNGSSTVAEELSIEIPTADARSCIRFQVVPTGPTQQAIVVEAVAEGSSAAQAGVQRGMKLTGISDPVRRNEVWQLQDRPSIRYIRDVLRMRSSPYIELRFIQPSDDSLLIAAEAAGDALQLATSSNTSGNANTDAVSSSGSSSSSTAGDQADSDTPGSLASLTSSSEEGNMTMAERMQQQYEQKQQASQGVVAFKQRQQRRKDYMEQVGKRNDNSFALILGASFLLPAVVILAVAYGSGYMDALYSNTMSNMR